MNLTRVYAICLRHFFLVIHQMERFFDLLLFPVLSLTLWGFLTEYANVLRFGTLAQFFLGGLILWVIFERFATNIGVDFMFDIWEKTIVNVLATPITVFEYTFGLVLVSLIKIVVSFVAMWFVASIFFGFHIESLGFSLAAFWINLVFFATSLAIFTIAMVIRYGHIIGPLTWILPFFLQPFSAVFYPVSILPPILQKVAWALPLSHVFEGMRFTLGTGGFQRSEFFIALGLNFIYFAIAVLFYVYMFDLVKRKGTLTKL